MPITGPNSYITVVPAFINHWNDAGDLIADIVLDGEQLGISGDVPLSYLTGLRDELTGRREELEATLLDEELARAVALQHRTWLQAACVLFNMTVRAEHGASIFAQVLPVAPQVADARAKFNLPIRRMLALWQKVDIYRAALTPAKPALVLSTGATLASAAARLASLVAAQDEVEEREGQASLDRLKREDVQNRIYPLLKLYREKIPTLFPADSPIVLSLPALTDDGQGSPQAPALVATPNETITQITLEGTASASASATEHQLRASVGEEPDAGDESLVASFETGQPITLVTSYGLGEPGARVHWRLVAITEDGHEAATPWQSFQRPLG